MALVVIQFFLVITCPSLLIIGSQRHGHAWKVDKNALNVDGLVHLAARMLLGTRIPVKEVPELFWQYILPVNNEEETVDLVLTLRRILNEEFGGISL